MQKIYIWMITTGISSIVGGNGALVASITINSAPSDSTKSTMQLVICDSVKIYLGIYTFFRRDAFFGIDFIPFVVLFFRNSCSIRPVRRYTG